MTSVLRCLDASQNGLLESPTGTGLEHLFIGWPEQGKIFNFSRQNPLLALFHPGLVGEGESRPAVKGSYTRGWSCHRVGSPCQAQDHLLFQVGTKLSTPPVHAAYLTINHLHIDLFLRTHSQLSQAVSELARTSYRYMKVSKHFKTIMVLHGTWPIQ